MPLAELVRPGVKLAREGLIVNRQQAYLFSILAPILAREPMGASIYAPEGHPLREGETVSFGALAATLERFGDEGPEPFYRGDLAATMSAAVLRGRGVPHDRRPGGVRDDLPDSGARRLPRARDPDQPASVLRRDPDRIRPRAARPARLERSRDADRRDGGGAGGADARVPRRASTRRASRGGSSPTRRSRPPPSAAGRRCAGDDGPEPMDRFGSTTHITAIDTDGGCATVTCSNGTGSGVFAGDTGIQLNNMLGEADLNPFGFHATPAGRRMPSMMSPTVVLRDGELELGLGSGGSNRIRSAITQTIVRCLDEGLGDRGRRRGPAAPLRGGRGPRRAGDLTGGARPARRPRLRRRPLAGSQPLLRRRPRGRAHRRRAPRGRGSPPRRRRGEGVKTSLV